jgi:hypothetical protein
MDSMNTAEVQRAFGGIRFDVIVDDGRHTVPGISSPCPRHLRRPLAISAAFVSAHAHKFSPISDRNDLRQPLPAPQA